MAFARKVVLHCPQGDRTKLDALVEAFLRDGVAYVGVGVDCAKVEDIVDELVVGDGSSEGFILTSKRSAEKSPDTIYCLETRANTGFPRFPGSSSE